MSRLVFRNVNVFNPLTGKLNEGKTIVIKNKYINWIGPESSYDKESNDEIIDVSGKTVLPGMIDTHIHIEITHLFLHNFEKELPIIPFKSDSADSIKSAKNLPDMIEYD